MLHVFMPNMFLDNSNKVFQLSFTVGALDLVPKPELCHGFLAVIFINYWSVLSYQILKKQSCEYVWLISSS